MTKEKLPLTIDPVKLAQKSVQMQGALEIANMERLSASLAKSDGQVAIELEFGQDAQGLYYINGKLTADMTLQCQRCLKPMSYKLEAAFSLSPVKTEEKAAELPDHYEALITQGQPVEVLQMVEDELILALPLVPRHESDTCQSAPLDEEQIEKPQTTKPFKDLKQLLTSKKTS